MHDEPAKDAAGTPYPKDEEKRPRSVAMTATVKRACDACHRRKVKCDGITPCRNCASSQLSCTYNAIPQKKGPKGSRAKVISELRETQRQTSLSVTMQSPAPGVANSPPRPALAPTPGLLTPEMAKDCVDFFFAHMYPTMPILQRPRLEQQAMYMDSNLDTYCFLTSLCAWIVLQPGMSIPGADPYGFDTMPGANIVSATLLMEETCRVRKAYDYFDSPSFNSLCTSYFLYCCYFGLDMHDKAWVHLREATTLVHLVAMHKEETYRHYDAIEAARRRRLYWLLFVTERASALRHQRPLSLQASINPPSVNDDPADPLAHQLSNYLSLVHLFRPFGDALVSLWNKVSGACSPTLVQALQKQLRESLPPHLNELPAQLSEMPITQQWLKNLHWQLSVANGNGNDTGGKPYPYSLDIARDLMPMVSHFPSNIGLLGLGLMEKLYGIAYAFHEYLSMQQGPRDPFTRGPRQILHDMLNVMTMLRSGDYRFLPLLLCKMTDDLPRMANPMLPNAPENANLCDVDIFDGLGNARMLMPASFLSTGPVFGAVQDNCGAGFLAC